MSEPIKRQDIIDDEALQAPLMMVDNLEKMAAVMVKIRTMSNQTNNQAQQSTSIKQTTDAVSLLVTQEKELVKVQKQLADATAKDNEQYIAYKKAVDQANQALKDKVALGSKDAQQINATNASMKELEAALKKNRQAYANLTNEQARNSKEGKNLITVIQRQDKELKNLAKSTGQHQLNVGNYSSALQGLDGVTGGVVGRFQQLGKAFLAILSNPIVLALTALVGVFVALKSSVETFFSSTAEGEEKLSRQKATWDAFFITLKQGWADVGKSVFDFFGEDGLKGLFDTFLLRYFPTLWARFQVTEKRSQELNAKLRQLTKDHAEDVVDDANTELKANKLIEISRNKLDYSAEQRMAALKEHNRIKNEQLEGDIKLAKDDLAAFDLRIKMERKNGELLLADITERSRLEVALIKVQSDASAARTGFLKLEKALADEIHQDRINQLNEEFEKSIALKQAEVDKAIALVQKEVIEGRKTKTDGDKEIAHIRKAIQDDLIQSQIDGLNRLLESEELTAEERAEIEKRLAKLKVDLNNALYDQVVELDVAVVNSGESLVQKLESIYSEFFDSLNSILSSASDRRMQAIDEEIAAFEERYQKELQLAGDNEAAKEQIDLRAEARRKVLEQKRREEQIRQARMDKSLAIIGAAINTHRAYTAALSKFPGPPKTIPDAILAAVLGGIQVAAIASKPIPQFYKGTDNAPEGPALVGELGREIKVEPSGKVSLTPDVPTIDYLRAGTKIIPHDESMKMLAAASFGREALIHREQTQQIELAQTLRETSKKIVSAIKANRPGNLYREGSMVYEAKTDEHGNRKLIRRSNLSK